MAEGQKSRQDEIMKYLLYRILEVGFIVAIVTIMANQIGSFHAL